MKEKIYIYYFPEIISPLLAFIDAKAAFDTVDPDILIKRLAYNLVWTQLMTSGMAALLPGWTDNYGSNNLDLDMFLEWFTLSLLKTSPW